MKDFVFQFSPQLAVKSGYHVFFNGSIYEPKRVVIAFEDVTPVLVVQHILNDDEIYVKVSSSLPLIEYVRIKRDDPDLSTQEYFSRMQKLKSEIIKHRVFNKGKKLKGA
ncbi:hypothetical protein [Cohnella cholangitidis]|uniref:Uncharacterized protein n=1 Tax=Cohnella cholangitidis TaxID=2598458 RepID=A0A7G5C470_9BACL|nr:hypothetical protein [Cohnella cholangitidis]QMV44004.1 hypothetical protein FPL14_24640 [Cohnella cholangitidis]